MRTRLLRRASIGALTLTLIGALGIGGAQADNVVADGDGLTPVVASSLSIGNVACGATTTKTVALAVSHNGGGTNNRNVFAGSAVVTVSVGGTTGTGLSATAPASTITLPSDWVSSPNNTQSDVVYSSVTLTSTTAGSGSGTVTYSASGRNQDGVSTTTITSTLNVSWTTGTCVTTTPTTTTVTCPTVHQTYTSAALEPCTALVTGTNGFSQVLPVTYTANTNAGLATASASFVGDSTHLASSSSSNFTIDPASSTVTVSCPATVTYDGTEKTPCAASYTGAGLPASTGLTPTYSNNTNAGTATASASWSGDPNHTAGRDSKDFTIAKAPSATTISCDSSGLAYTGTHLAPCTAEATGVGLPKQAVAVTYDPNDVDAGPVTATASYGGDSNHEPSNAATATFAIGQASTVTSITCDPAAQTFDGAPHAICSARVTGPDFTAPLTVAYDDNVNAGTVHVTATFNSTGNYASSSASASFVIAKAQPVVTIGCTPAVVTYDGTAHKPCSASVSGPGMPSEALAVRYANNVDAGTATADAEYVETANYLGATGSSTFVINPATSTLTVSCARAVYDGTPKTPCDATVSGDGVIDPDVVIAYVYSDNTRAGSNASVSATWPGDRNHMASSAIGVFSIDKAASSVSVDCPTKVTFTGGEQTPCTASVEAPGVKVVDEAHPILWAYTNNVHAGLASVSAIWDGDTNHYGSHSDPVTFTIDKAESTVSLICPATVTFTGGPQTPCSATASGAGMADVGLMPDYTNNVTAGTAHATASWAGDDDHTASNDGKNFTIDKAPSEVSVTCNPSSVTFTGSPIEPCSARASGAGGLDASVSVTYANNVAVGTATATGTYPGDANHLGSTGSGTFTIGSWTPSGFYQPVDVGDTVNVVKNGSTVPLKFEVFRDGVELTSTSIVTSFSSTPIACDASAVVDELPVTTTGGTSLRYDTTAGQFVQNWQTPKKPGACYLVTMTTQDKSFIKAKFKLK